MNFRQAFTAELLDVGRPGISKVAGIFAPHPDRLVERLTATGALSSGAMHGLAKGRAAMTADPYDGPEGTFGGALAKGAVGGLLAALGIKAIGRLTKKH